MDKRLVFFIIMFFVISLFLKANHSSLLLNNNEYSGIHIRHNDWSISAKTITDTLTLGGGCFWCLEAIFQQTKGVISVKSGYAGGKIPNPSYEEVCGGQTGHAEVIQLVFDRKKITLSELLEIFFSMHDPTTLNRQVADEGEQYRSIILYRNSDQKKICDLIMREINAEKIFDNPVVTQVVPYSHFYPAEDYHQNYYNRNKNKGYCRMVIVPKLEKYEKLFQKFKQN